MFTAAIIAAVLAAVAGTYQTVNAYQNAKIQQKEAEANAQQAEYEAQMERNAEAMNANKTRREARARIAAAKAKYGAYGNIGESADATIEDAYVNLFGAKAPSINDDQNLKHIMSMILTKPFLLKLLISKLPMTLVVSFLKYFYGHLYYS